MTMARTIKTGTITAAGSSSAASDAGGSSVTLALALGSEAALAVISGTFTATLVFEGQAAGGSWVSVPAVPVTGGAIVTGASAAGNFLILAVGMIQVRVRCSAWTSAPTVELSNAPAGGISFPYAGTGTAAGQVQGTAADGAAASGNPVQVGGVDGSANAQALLTDTSGRAIVNGNLADSGTVSGSGVNPIMIGGQDNGGLLRRLGTFVPSVDTLGQSAQVALLCYSAPALLNGSNVFERGRAVAGDAMSIVGMSASGTMLWDGSQFVRARSAVSDGLGGTGVVSAGNMGWNTATWDRFYNNTQGTLLASSARTGTTQASQQVNYNARGVLVTLNITIASGTGGLQVQIQGQEQIGANNYGLMALPTAIIATGTYVYEIYPGAATAGVAGSQSVNVRTQGTLPRNWLARVVHGDGSSYTYSLGYQLIL